MNVKSNADGGLRGTVAEACGTVDGLKRWVFDGGRLLGAHPGRGLARRRGQPARLPKESGKGHSAGESAKAPAVPTGSAAAAGKGAAGGRRQTGGPKSAPRPSRTHGRSTGLAAPETERASAPGAGDTIEGRG